MKLQFSRTQASPVEPHPAKGSKTSGAKEGEKHRLIRSKHCPLPSP